MMRVNVRCPRRVSGERARRRRNARRRKVVVWRLNRSRPSIGAPSSATFNGKGNPAPPGRSVGACEEGYEKDGEVQEGVREGQAGEVCEAAQG